MHRLYTPVFLVGRISYLLLIFQLVFIAGAYAQITVNSVVGTAITCPNNGSISVSATTTSPPLLYSIIAGPVSQPAQTNPLFTSLLPGNYTVKIADGAGHEVTQNVTVPGSYQNPSFTVTPTTPYCVGDSNGSLTGTVNPGTGTPPYTWQLFTGLPITIPAPVNSTFSGLPAGNYTMRVTDACGSFTSQAVSIMNPVTQFGFWAQNIGEEGSLPAIKVGCDSMRVTYWLDLPNPRFPLTFKYHTSNGVYIPTSGTTIDTSQLSYNGPVMVSQIIPGADYGDFLKGYIYNACGDSAVTVGITTHPFIFYPKYSFNDCGSTAMVTFTNTPYNEYHTSIKPPIHYTFTDLTTGNVIQSTTVTLEQNNGIFGITDTILTGGSYNFTITDGCGQTFSSNYIVPALAPPTIIHQDIISSACIDSVLGTYRILTAGFQYNAKLIMLSGPSTLGSTKPGFAYSDTYTYPDTVPIINGETFLINNLAVGTYQYKIIDDCGNVMPGSITVSPSQVTGLKKNYTLQKGCPGKNKILFSMVSGGKVTITNLANNAILKEKDFIAYTDNNQAAYYNKDSLINLPDGTYEIRYEFKQLIGALENGKAINDQYTSCWTLVDTVHIPPYQTPQMSTGNVIMCNNAINFVLFPDTTTGLQPYQYEIIAGPQTFPSQSSPIFNITQPGIYTARIHDACGNASIKLISADTLSFEPIQVQSNCTSTGIIFPSSLYDSYHWLMPNNQVHVGDSLFIQPITPADTGIYHISKIININGCADTLYTTYHVTLNPHSSHTVEFCAGSSVLVGNHTYYLPGTYRDTINTLQGCDSIVTTNLVLIEQHSDTTIVQLCFGDSIQLAGQFQHTAGFYTDSVQNTLGCYDYLITDLRINPLIIDTVNASICNGQTYNFGGAVYSQAGYYSDTLSTANGCDSVSVLHLTTTPFIQHALQNTICAGSTYSFGGSILSASGIYSDTLSTPTCDSIVTLTLTVLPYPHDSIAATICPSQTYTFGGIALNQPGIYTDTLSTNGCDSIVTLTLTSAPYLQSTLQVSICSGTTYTLGANTLSTAGIYTDTLSTNTCDSIVTLTLSVLPYKQRAISATICGGQSYPFGGQALTNAGVYTDTLSTNTCDSIVTLTLSVLPYKHSSLTQTICQGAGYTSGGHTYTTAGTYVDTVATSTCDSIVTLILNVLPLQHTIINASICANQKYTFGNVDYINAGTYSHTYPTGHCDSIVTLVLTVTQPPSVHIVSNAIDTYNGTLVHLNAVSSSSPLTYSWTSSAGLNDYHIANPTAILQNSGWFYVTVTNAAGCSAIDSLWVEALVTSTLYIPNTFTPDGQNFNEIFRAFGTNIKEFKIMVFDRWGELIFESNNIETGWDATYMGDPVQDDLYVYKVMATGMDNKKYDWIGHITVLR